MSKLIVIDPGHGGNDNGAVYNGRVEDADNLRLSLAVRDRLNAYGQRTLMTRETDVAVGLSERAQIANQANADLFISLHRNSSPQQSATANGAEAWIYTTAGTTTQRIGQMLLDAVVNVGVQSNRGLKRGNYAVLRETTMPAVLMEMGFMNNDEDNRLFDANLDAYADAIALAAIEALGESPVRPTPTGPTGPAVVNPELPGSITPDETIRRIQQMLNESFGAGVENGIYDDRTKQALVRAMQVTLNQLYGAQLQFNGIYDTATRNATPALSTGSENNLVYLLQCALYASGYNPGTIDGVYGANTRQAVIRFQQANGLTADGIAGKDTFTALLS